MMEKLLSEAKRHVADLNCEGSRLAPERLADVFGFVRLLRKELTSPSLIDGRPKLEEAYETLVMAMHRSLHAGVEGLSSRALRVLTGGNANIYTGLLEGEDESFFIKAEPLDPSPEYFLVNALSRGLVPKDGPTYSFQVPVAIIEVGGLRSYIYRTIEDLAALNMSFSRDPGSVRTIIRGLAEMNSSMGLLSIDECPGFLTPLQTSLRELDRSRIRNVFQELDDQEVDRLYQKLERIRGQWSVMEDVARSSPWALAVGDLASANATLRDGKLVFLDVGAACFAPVGTDLFWLLFKNRGNLEAKESILHDYQYELNKCGVDVDYKTIKYNAYGQYYRKWLIPRSRGSRKHLGTLRATIEGAGVMLSEILDHN